MIASRNDHSSYFVRADITYRSRRFVVHVLSTELTTKSHHKDWQ